MPFRPSAPSGLGRHGRPVSRHLVGLHLVEQARRSKALAQREGRIGARPHLTAAQRQTASRLVSGYERHSNASASAGNLGHALAGLGHAYTHNPVYRAPVIGHSGVLGALGDLVKMQDPVAMLQAVEAQRHPIRTFQQSTAAGKAAAAAYKRGDITQAEAIRRAPVYGGIIVGGPGGGFRASSLERSARFVERPRTRAEAEARLSQLEAQQEKFHKALVGRYKTVLPEEQRRLNVAKGLARKSAQGERVKGGKRAGRVEQPQGTVADEFLQRVVDEAVAKQPNHPAVKAYLKNIDEASALREALNAQHMPGETAVAAGNYGTVRVPAPARGPLVRPAKVADTPALPGLEASVPKTRGPLPKTRGPLPAAEAALGASAKELRLSLSGKGGAREVAARQKQIISEEKGLRVQRAKAAYEKAGGGSAGERAARRELAGAYPKAVFTKLREGSLSEADKEDLVRYAGAHPNLDFFDQRRAAGAIRKAWRQEPLQDSEVETLAKAFGRTEAEELRKYSLLHHLGAIALDVLNIPRTLRSTADVSLALRQALAVLAGYPRIWGPGFVKLLKYAPSKAAYERDMAALESHPKYEESLDAGVSYTHPTERPEDIEQREEFLPSQILERIPVAGQVFKGSHRSYSGGRANYNIHLYDHLTEKAARKGYNIEDPKLQKDIGRYVNILTGRGGLPGPFKGTGPALNTFFFAPKLISARIGLMLMPFRPDVSHFVRVEAAKTLVRLGGGTGLALYGGSKLLGGTVGADPTSSDFAKLKIGNTRVDVLGGFQQYLRLASQVATGRYTSSTTGKEIRLGHGIGKLGRPDITWRFVRGKFNPTTAFVYDFFSGSDYEGKPFKWKKEFLQNTYPLVAQDVYDLYHNTGSVPFASLGYFISALGVGIQTYGPQAPKPKRPTGSGTTNPLGSSDGGAPVYGGGGGSSGGSAPIYGGG